MSNTKRKDKTIEEQLIDKNFKRCYNYYISKNKESYIDEDEFRQEMYLAIRKISKSYKSNKSKFSTYIYNYLPYTVLNNILDKYSISLVRLPLWIRSKKAEERQWTKNIEQSYVSLYNYTRYNSNNDDVDFFINNLEDRYNFTDLDYEIDSKKYIAILYKDLSTVLNDREKRIIYMHYYLGYSFSKIGEELGISSTYSHFLSKNAIQKIRNKFKERSII